MLFAFAKAGGTNNVRADKTDAISNERKDLLIIGVVMKLNAL
jgi:hypothetical protein